ncbi:MAG: hypothetical protein JO301_03850, partial [Chitinophagaceae bacterium]|nr:hypothetical protein [Chitinophagaceae bacterium]
PAAFSSARYGLAIVVATCITAGAFAQDDSASRGSGGSYFKISANYLSNSVYYGRKDSLPLSYLTLAARYHDKSGFYLAGSVSYLTGNQGRIDLAAIDAGYSFGGRAAFSGEVYANKSWYSQLSGNPRGDIKGSIGSQLGYDLGILQLNGGSDINFADKTDIGLNLGVSRDISFGRDREFDIEPSFTVNWSTLHSYEGFISRQSKRRISPPGGAVLSAVTNVQNNKMTLLNFEIALPLSYESGRFGWFITPYYSIPKNPIYTTTTVTTRQNNGQTNSVTTNSTPASELNLSNTFYLELELYIKIK